MTLQEWLSEKHLSLFKDETDLVRDFIHYLKKALGLSRFDLLRPESILLTAEQCDQLDHAYERLLDHEPVSKILGLKGFWKDDFYVTKDVLDPRPDSELIIEKALHYCGHDYQGDVLDLGTGSGCLILSLLREWPEAKGMALDYSEKALQVAKENARRLSLEDRVIFQKSNWYSALEGTGKRFGCIISNPPYIRSSDIVGLSEKVKRFDPLLALDGGADGLDPYRILLQDLALYLEPDGYLILECGYDQARDIAILVSTYGYDLVEIAKDLQGHERCLIFKLKNY
ncbi:MAG: peptide chain release factor N(5)-glutamine methyltransferase [Alphaproteobacteria bacterium]|jgi:release factor glutamine methyltransferase|nr:peptide chain release factor N(5)-glutamine methyltransferase [Alphaproteobacteria bacterium]MBP9877744.1 peptide chain release factor N(5)-glutamine methyltransferase [Alphaproteobacteria bacterium]